MAFIVEDGSGLPNSNAYVSVAAFREYHTDRGVDLSAYTDAQLQVAIIKATDFLEDRYRYIGQIRLSTQALEWPRINAFYRDGRVASLVPVEITRATLILGQIALTEDLFILPTVSTNGQLVKRERVRVDVIEEAIEYQEGGIVQTQREFPQVESLLQGLIVSGQFLLRV